MNSYGDTINNSRIYLYLYADNFVTEYITKDGVKITFPLPPQSQRPQQINTLLLF